MNRNIAVVTGASSGLGREYARLLTQEPEVEEIWAIARDLRRLAQLKESLGDKIIPISLDLSRIDEIKKFQDRLKEEQPRIIWAINNAGFAKLCDYGDLTIEDSLNMIDLNCGGIVAMALACIPYMPKGSHMLNTASQAAFQPLPFQNLYSSTKAFVRNYSRALNVELKIKGIAVTAVCPGWMDTALFDRAKIGAERATRRFVGMVTPDKVAQKALSDAKKGRDISVYSLYVKTAHLVAKLLPQRIMMKIWLRQQGL